jgi:uncharacterized protein DUF2846
MHNNLVSLIKVHPCVPSGALLLVFAVGCVTGPEFSNPRQPTGDNALVYVFRHSSPPYALKPTMLINGTKAAELASRGYFDTELKPGSYTIKADWSFPSGVPDAELTLQAAPGQTYYIVVDSTMHTGSIVPSAGTVVIIPKFTSGIALVENQAAMFDIAQCRLVKMYSEAALEIGPMAR